MRERKKSGLDWLAEIPVNWEVRKIKDLLTIQTGFTPDTKHDEYYDPDGFDWLTIGDLSGRVIPSSTSKHISQNYLDTYPQRITPKGSLLYSFKLSVGQVAFTDREIYTNEAIASFLPNSNVDLGYLYYASFMIEKNANDNIYGAKILNQDLIKNAKILLPPLKEQKRIAQHLDEFCYTIEGQVGEIRNSIEEYRKLKLSLIANTVCKGIQPRRQYKECNIPWLTTIPCDWECKPFKYIMTERVEKNDPIISTERLSLSIGLGVTLFSEKTTNLDRFKDDFSQYKIAREGDLVLNSMNMIVGAVGVSKYFGCISPAYYSFYDTTEGHITARYFDYLFHTKTLMRVFYSMGKGIYAIERGDDRVNTCRLKVSRDDLRSMLCPFPPLKEQKQIVEYLDKTCTEIDAIIDAKQKFLQTLMLYKSSVIYEYVTGTKVIE